jgi:protein-S-isoprenylcysteine O-methyltransferase Ste14
MPVVPPPLIALAAGVAQHRLASGNRPGGVRKIGAGAAAAGSVWLLAATSARFRRAGTTFEPFDPARATELVTSGPNSITRNPMYVGMAGLLTAHALYRGGWATLLPVAGFVGVIDRVQIRPEEAALRELFGTAYEDYCRSVRRWL